MKSYIFLLLIFCSVLLFSATGCTPRQREPEPSSAVVQSSAPDTPSQQEILQTPTAIAEQLVMLYGAEENEEGQLVPLPISLLYSSDWSSPDDLSTISYLSWFLGYIWNMDYEEIQQRYTSPLGQDYGWFFPEEEFEATVQKYFAVSTQTLRTDTSIYLKEYHGYQSPSGGGIGERPIISITEVTEQADNILQIHLTMQGSMETEHRILAVQKQESGNYRFLSYTTDIGSKL